MSPIPGAFEGAFVAVLLYALVLCIFWWIGGALYTWICKAKLWDRYCRACGGPVSAMQVLVAAEKLDDHLRRGFKAAKRYGWLERFL